MGKGKDGMPDREQSIYEGRAMGESMATWGMQQVPYSTGSRAWSLILECLVLPFSGPGMGKLLNHPGL